MPPISVDWSEVVTMSVAFMAGIVVKGLLDLRLGTWIVRLFWWIPTRWLFRDSPPAISGQWENIWESGGSETYAAATDRHSHPVIWQFGRYIYAEFFSQGRKFGFFGRISADYIVGEWFDVNDKWGYFGAYQLRMVDSNRMEGMWIGHSKKSHGIRADKSVWTRINR